MTEPIRKFIKKLWLKPLILFAYIISLDYHNNRTFKSVWYEVKKEQGLL